MKNYRSKLVLLILSAILFITIPSIEGATYVFELDDFEQRFMQTSLLTNTSNAYLLTTGGATSYHVGDNATFLPITDDINEVMMGIIFENISIYEHNEIYDAILQLYFYTNTSGLDADALNVGMQILSVYPITEANATLFSTEADFISRSLGTPKLSYYLPIVNDPSPSGQYEPTAQPYSFNISVKELIQEIVQTAGFEDSGAGRSNLGFMILVDQHGNEYNSYDTSMFSFNGSSTYAPRLHLSTLNYGGANIQPEMWSDPYYRDGMWVGGYWTFDDYAGIYQDQSYEPLWLEATHLGAGYQTNAYGWQQYYLLTPTVINQIYYSSTGADNQDISSYRSSLFHRSNAMGWAEGLRKYFDFSNSSNAGDENAYNSLYVRAWETLVDSDGRGANVERFGIYPEADSYSTLNRETDGLYFDPPWEFDVLRNDTSDVWAGSLEFRLTYNTGGSAPRQGYLDDLWVWIYFPANQDWQSLNLTLAFGGLNSTGDWNDYPNDVYVLLGDFSTYPQYQNESLYDQRLVSENTTLYCEWWDDGFNLDTLLLETNYTGANVNHTLITNAGTDEIIANYTHQWDGENMTVSYRWIANNTLGNYNSTDWITLMGVDFKLNNASLSNDDIWIFEGEVYDLEATFTNAHLGYLNFTDGDHDIRFRFNNFTRQTWIEVDPNDQFVIGLAYSSMTFYAGNVSTILWRFIPDRSIIDYNNSLLDYWIYNQDTGVELNGTTGISFGIYNLGGFASYNYTGDAGRVVGGDTFEIWAENSTGGSYAYAETIFRKLQGVHLVYSLDVEDGDCFDHHEQTGYVEMGIQFRYNGSWETGWLYHLTIVNGAVDAGGGGIGKAWIIPYIDWYSRSSGGTVTNPVDDILSAYPECGDRVNSLKTDVRFWVDLWFNRMNASTVVGGRVNSYYYGMDEGGWMLWTNWQPVFMNETSSMYFDDLRLPDGNITDSLEIELVKFWVKVGKVGSGDPAGGDCDNHRWSLRNYEIMNWQIAPDRMQGIDTPIFVDTKVVNMPQTGFLQPLYNVINGLSRSIWMGALGFIKILWGAMDSIFEWAGFGEGFFSSITEFIMELPRLFSTMMENIGRLFDGFIDTIEDTINMALAYMPQFAIGFGWLTETMIDYWSIVMGLFNGELVPFSIIQDIQLGDWLRFGFALLPAYEVFSILFSDDPARRTKERVEFWGMVFRGALGFFRMIYQILSNVIGTIFKILPI